jgi:hypothetical protein
MVRLGKSYPHKLSPGVPRLGRLAHYLAHSLSIQKARVRSDPERWAARLARSVIGSVLSAVLCFSPVEALAVENEVIKYQTYAGSLLTPLEFSSALTLWNKESNWNPKAKNGSHYGICQGRSKYLIKANYKQQIRWCISYAFNRYGSITKALDHWKVHKWH